VQKEAGESFSSLMKNLGVDPAKIAKINIQVKDESGLNFWLATILPILLPFLLIGGFIYFMMRSAQGANNRAMSFGQSQAKEFTPSDKEKVTFKDIAGVKEAKEEFGRYKENYSSFKNTLIDHLFSLSQSVQHDFVNPVRKLKEKMSARRP